MIDISFLSEGCKEKSKLLLKNVSPGYEQTITL
jgi:hypothetical protein